MIDYSEKTCPLCKKDYSELLAGQKLKPCQCGYQICVWCWHRIKDMAEKDQTEGRCPACRIPYDKEKSFGINSNLYRLTTEGRKQLTNVRGVQRNLVHISGLPLNLADEHLLLRREYFGQYGKVLKVSMNRSPTGVIKQFAKNTCQVYIAYAKEEEAIRCIESVNGFILDGKVLRACFGKNNYCHAWIRNGACKNPDCLYLHEFCSLEDSFTKDKIISAQKITGTSNALQDCSVAMLPPPLDAYCSDSSTVKSPSTTKSARDEGHCDQGSIRQRGNNVTDLEHFRKTPPVNTDAEADIAQNGNPGLRPDWGWRSQMPENSTLNKSNRSELAEATSYVAKLLDESDRKASTLEPSNLLQQQNDKSRFSFPRHEESFNQACDYNNTYSIYGQMSRDQSTQAFGESQSGFASNFSGGYEQFAASPAFPSYKSPALRSQVSAPPGFSVPSTSRLPPPGFSSHETSDITSGTRLLDSSSVLRNAYHAPPPSSNLNTGGDIEFMDPAVLSVGRGIFHNGTETTDFDMRSRSGFSSHPNSFENGVRFQLLAQRSLAAQQVNGFHDPRNVHNISPSLFDPYENSLRLVDQTQGTRFSSLTRLPRQASLNPLFSNGRWDQWNETQSGNNTLGMTQLQDNVYSRLEEPTFPRPGPGDPYNRT